MAKLTPEDQLNICTDYRNMTHPSVRELGKKYGVSQQAVWMVLKKHGIDTFKGGRPKTTATTEGYLEVAVSSLDTYEDNGEVRPKDMDDFYKVPDLSGSDEGPEYDSLVEDIHDELVTGAITKEQALERLKQLKREWMGDARVD